MSFTEPYIDSEISYRQELARRAGERSRVHPVRRRRAQPPASWVRRRASS